MRVLKVALAIVPSYKYIDPALEAELAYTGTSLTYDGSIPSSYGMDFLEVRLDPSVQGQALTLYFQGQGSQARFNVQIWMLGPGYAEPRAVTSRPETLPQNPHGSYSHFVPQVDTTAANRLALIVTRLDPHETADPLGSYTITAKPAG